MAGEPFHRGRRVIAALIASALALSATVVAVGCTPAPSTAPSGGVGSGGVSSLAPAADPAGPYAVVDVVDGDTLKVDRNGKKVTIRLIGLDTPETRDPRKTVQCFGREASARAHELLDGQRVTLTSDPSQDAVDKYGRTLSYVWLPDGRLVNQVLIAEGYGHEYTYDIPYQYQAAFKAAERDAREHDRGLWSPSTCHGDTSN